MVTRMSLPIAVSAFIVLCSDVGCSASTVDEATSALRSRLHTAQLRAAVEDNEKLLRSKVFADRKKAVLFFYDMRAREVLLALLPIKVGPGNEEFARSWDSELGLRIRVTEMCSDAFCVEDVPALCDVACSAASGYSTASGEANAGIASLQEGILRCACRALGVEWEAPKDGRRWFRNQGAIIEWFVATVKAAKGKPGYVQPLDSVLNAIEARQAQGTPASVPTEEKR